MPWFCRVSILNAMYKVELTCTEVLKGENSTFADHTPHRISISDIAHQQLVRVEHVSGQMHRLCWSQEPTPVKPRITTGTSTKKRSTHGEGALLKITLTFGQSTFSLSWQCKIAVHQSASTRSHLQWITAACGEHYLELLT